MVFECMSADEDDGKATLCNCPMHSARKTGGRPWCQDLGRPFSSTLLMDLHAEDAAAEAI